MSILNSEKGITLTEILFSAIIIGMVIAGILVIFVQTVDISRRVNYEYTAISLAKNRLERARTVMATSGFDFLSDLEETDSIIDSNGVPDPAGDFKRSTTVTTNYSGNPRLTKIEVSVVYKYRNQWKADIPIGISALFTNVEE